MYYKVSSAALPLLIANTSALWGLGAAIFESKREEERGGAGQGESERRKANIERTMWPAKQLQMRCATFDRLPGRKIKFSSWFWRFFLCRLSQTSLQAARIKHTHSEVVAHTQTQTAAMAVAAYVKCFWWTHGMQSTVSAILFALCWTLSSNY